MYIANKLLVAASEQNCKSPQEAFTNSHYSQKLTYAYTTWLNCS